MLQGEPVVPRKMTATLMDSLLSGSSIDKDVFTSGRRAPSRCEKTQPCTSRCWVGKIFMYPFTVEGACSIFLSSSISSAISDPSLPHSGAILELDPVPSPLRRRENFVSQHQRGLDSTSILKCARDRRHRPSPSPVL